MFSAGRLFVLPILPIQKEFRWPADGFSNLRCCFSVLFLLAKLLSLTHQRRSLCISSTLIIGLNECSNTALTVNTSTSMKTTMCTVIKVVVAAPPLVIVTKTYDYDPMLWHIVKD